MKPKSSKNLLITLGHNSSAIFVSGNSVIGYEQERLSGIKGDSQFPIDAINEIIHNVGINDVKGCNVFISHWLDHKGDKYEFVPTKYMTQKDYEFLCSISKPEFISFVDNSFTHHDAHAWSALSFFEYFHSSCKKLPVKQLYTIVADGFGTNREVISIYQSFYNKDKAPKLIHRVYGYEASLGLMYQYATSFCGMKENQDEYKFLGYESHVEEYFSHEKITFLNNRIIEETHRLVGLFEHNTEAPSDVETGTINEKYLTRIKCDWHERFSNILNGLTGDDAELNEFSIRVAIAYVIQGIIERFFEHIVHMFNMVNVLLAGGCFYNVKLNKHIFDCCGGKFCVMPLAGDQGAAIGMYHRFAQSQFPFGTLAIGKRRMYNAKKLMANVSYSRYIKINDGFEANEVAESIAQDIADGYIVNLIFGNMEFGPRALCNTSTLMLPTAENVANNNHMNNRNEVMPCAPVCTAKNAAELFYEEHLEQVVGSNHFMICTHEYQKPYSKQYAGVMHKLPITILDTYTGRPQIVRDGTFMHNVLTKVEEKCDAKCLVNTSFNVHGRPIAFDIIDILHNFEYQREHAKEGKEPLLYVIEIAEDNE